MKTIIVLSLFKMKPFSIRQLGSVFFWDLKNLCSHGVSPLPGARGHRRIRKICSQHHEKTRQPWLTRETLSHFWADFKHVQNLKDWIVSTAR